LTLVNDYDILCFVETKTDDVDEIDLPGFIIKMKNRFQFRRVKSGGIIVGFRKSLGDNISISEQWLTENNSLSILLTVQLFCLPRSSYAGGSSLSGVEFTLVRLFGMM
jgi:hypothetical protein